MAKSLSNLTRNTVVKDLVVKFSSNKLIETLNKATFYVSQSKHIPHLMKFELMQKTLQLLQLREEEKLEFRNGRSYYVETYFVRQRSHCDEYVDVNGEVEMWGLPSDSWLCYRCKRPVYEITKIK